MKSLRYFWMLFVLPYTIQTQEIIGKEITSSIKSATVFFNSAQIERTANLQLQKGTQTFRFVDLSPFVLSKSIQLQIPDVEIISIHFEKNYNTIIENSPEEQFYLKKLKALQNSLQKNTIALALTKEDIQFLKSNRNIGGNQTLTVSALREAAEYFSKAMKTLKSKEAELIKRLKQQEIEKKGIEKKLEDLGANKNFGRGEIIVNLRSKTAKNILTKLSYNVKNVGWFPSYDLKVKDINAPLEIVYKANLKQNSQVDWKDVKLRFSSANPTNSNKAGELIPYYLDYGTRPPVYNNKAGEVSGYVRDAEGPLPGVNVKIKGTSIATSTNFDGRYTIQVPQASHQLEFEFLGYKKEVRTIYSNTINVTMKEDESSLNEVVVVGFGAKKMKPEKKNVTLRGKASIEIADTESNYIETEAMQQQTSFEIEIVEPYSVKSSNKDFIINMKGYTTPADYTYFAIPRIENTAFLKTSIENWENMNLLEGEANVYLENTFIGTTLLDPRTTNKQLDISLGRDKSIGIQREKLNKYATKQVFGNKQEVQHHYNITIKNNKAQPVNIVVLDQIPVSTREEIKVTLSSGFSGAHDKKTGKLNWDLKIDPNTSKGVQFQYAVKYPKHRRLFLE